MARQQTIRINQGYQIDSKWEALALAGRGVRQVARSLWRYRTELGLICSVLAFRLIAGRQLSGGWASVVTGAVVVAGLIWHRSRVLLVGRLRCARTRRRLLDCMRETRVATSTGRLPLVLRSRATPAGERITFGVFPGQSAEQLEARIEEMRAAAKARDVTVTRDRSRADRVTVDVIRHDLLNRTVVLPSPLAALAAALLPRPATDQPAVPYPATPSQEVPS